MTLRQKLLYNGLVTAAGILLISIAALMGIFHVRQKVFDVTENATPQQLRTLEFTKTLQEHATLLSLASSLSTEAELSFREQELGRTLAKLKSIASELRTLRTQQSVSTIHETVGEVEKLTCQIIGSTKERVRSEQRAAQSRAEAQDLIRLNAEHRMNLQSSLKKLQSASISDLTRSSSKTKGMTAQFRMLQGAKDCLQQLVTAVNDLHAVSTVHDVSVIQGRATFAFEGLKPFAQGSEQVSQSIVALEGLMFAPNGPLYLKSAYLSKPDSGKHELFESAWNLCKTRLSETSRLVDEASDDTTATFYSENSQLEHKLADSDIIGNVMLLNTELSTATDAIANSLQNLVHEKDPDRIRASGDALKTLFDKTRHIAAEITHTLTTGEWEKEGRLIRETGAMLNRVERLVMKDAGIIETLETAARTRNRSEQLAAKLAETIRVQRAMGDGIAREAHDEQELTVGTVNWVVRAVMMLLVGAVVFVLGVTLYLDRRIGKSIMQLVEDLNKAKEDAEAANRAKSQFLANMSHEIRTPMNGVLGLLELLKASNLKEKQRHYVNMALSSSVALLNVINDILDFSKMEAGRMDLAKEEFDLLQTVEDAIALFSEQADTKKIELLCNVAPDAPRCLLGDPTRLRQIIINLIGNAVKFTESGEVALNVRAVTSYNGSATLRFEVSDTGIGIPKETQARIFDSFSQADSSTTRKFGGTGLGLSIAAQLTRMMGGEIGVESEPGRGSVFWFTARFDRPEQISGIPQDNEKRRGRSSLKGLRVLVVDDNATNRGILKDMLLAWGFAVETAASGQEALLRVAEAHRTEQPFKLAILDMMMPEMNGMELASAIRGSSDYEELRLIMLTSLDGSGDMDLARQVGITSYLVKPVRQSRLLNVITTTVGAEAADGPVAEGKIERHFPGAKVLLVEDHPVNQEVGRAILEQLGCSVRLAANGKIALELLACETYDLILMDCQMPEMDGYDATRAIRDIEEGRNGPTGHIPIVALTAHALEGDREKSLEAGMDDHLSKPFTFAELSETLSKYLPFEQMETEAASIKSGGSPHENVVKQEVAPLDEEVTSAIDHIVLDRIRAIEAQGSPGLVKTIIGHYVSESPKTFASLQQAIEANDVTAMLELAHSLKSASANVGAQTLAELCKKMELSGRNGSTQEGPELFSQMQHEYEIASEELMAEL